MLHTRNILGMFAFAAIAISPATASAQWWNHGGYNNGGYNGGYGGQRSFGGTINQVNNGSFQVNGRTVFLKDGTTINPRGVSLQQGENVQVTGTDAGNGAINATDVEISYNNGGYNGGYNNGGYNNGGYNGGYNNGGYNGGWRNGGWNHGGYNNGGWGNGYYNNNGHYYAPGSYNPNEARDRAWWRDHHDEHQDWNRGHDRDDRHDDRHDDHHDDH